MTCSNCGAELQVGDWPFCKGGHGPVRNFTVRPDAVPGGFVVENLSARPQTFYSKSEFKRAMDAAGVEQRIRHVPEQGSDKSPHTTRWI